MSKTKQLEMDAIEQLDASTYIEDAVASGQPHANIDTEQDITRFVNSSDFLKGKWYDIDRKLWAYEGQYYPESYRFQIQAADVRTVKYFASMDETNPLSVKDAVYNLIKTHIRVLDGNKVLNTLQTLYSHDQLRAMLLINLYTNTGNKLQANINVDGKTQTVDITLHSLMYGAISDRAKSYFDSKTGLFVFNTKSGLRAIYKPLTLADNEDLIAYSIKLRNNGSEIDKQFLNLAGFFMHNSSTVDAAYKEYDKSTDNLQQLALYVNILEKDVAFEQLATLNVADNSGRLGEYQIASISSSKRLFLDSSINDEY